MALVLSHKVNQISALLNLIQTLNKLVGEVVNPIDELLLHLDEGASNGLLPLRDDRLVLLVLLDCFVSVRLD